MWIPDAGNEAIGDLSRAREDTVNARTQARHQLTAFLLRHGIRYSGKTAWSRGLYQAAHRGGMELLLHSAPRAGRTGAPEAAGRADQGDRPGRLPPAPVTRE